MTGEDQIRRLVQALSLAAALAWAAPTAAQILGGRLPGGLGGLPHLDPPRLTQAPALAAPVPKVLNAAGELVAAPLTEVRRLTAERRLREHLDVIEADDQGRPVVRGEILAIGVGRDTLAQLRRAGFAVRDENTLAALGIEMTVLGAPKGLSAVEAVRRLRTLDPGGRYDFNHLYEEAAAVDASASPKPSIPAADGRGLQIGLVDGSVAPSDPALSRVRLVQRAFAAGGAQVTPHATAVASLIAGVAGRFHGAAPGAAIYVADVYGPKPTGGSAEAVARGLAWLAQSNTPVINISLVGPPNLLLEAAVQALLAKGVLVVAAVGNDGPAAPPLYPAGYSGVVAVTAVDAHGRVLPEAGRGTHVDFAAPGSDMAAASATGGYVGVRGTSFAAPLVAGRLAILRSRGSSAQALEALGREAVDLGAPGPDPIYGRGLVGAELRVDPATVRLAR